MHFNLCKILNRPGSVLNKKFRYQLLATLTFNIITFSHGVATGWTSPTLRLLQSSASPLSFSLSIDEASWIGSLVGLGSVVGCLLFGNFLNLVGRKTCIYMIPLPQICLWILIYCAQSPVYLYVGRFLGGVTGGSSFLVIPIFISEIADTSIRGTLASTLVLSVTFGTLMGYILSTHLSYHLMPCVALFLPIIYLIGTLFFPETPQHLLRQGDYLAAESSFRFYKNCTSDMQKCNQEFDDLKAIITKPGANRRISRKDFSLKTICIATMLIVSNQATGTYAFVNYMSHIFAETGSSLDPNTSAIIIGAVQIFGAYSATLFVDRYGRKILMLISTSGMALALTLLGLFTFIGRSEDLSAYNWVPIVLMTSIIFIANIGVVPLPFVIIVEIFPSKIRSLATSISFAVLSGMTFVMLKVFPIYMHNFGVSVALWSCGAMSVLCFIFFAIFLKETKGKSMDVD